MRTRWIVTVVTLALLAAIAAPALARPHGRYRQPRSCPDRGQIEWRIEVGLRNGYLSFWEARGLRDDLYRIGRMELGFRSDGCLSPRERQILCGEERELAFRVFRERHDCDHRGWCDRHRCDHGRDRDWDDRGDRGGWNGRGDGRGDGRDRDGDWDDWKK